MHVPIGHSSLIGCGFSPIMWYTYQDSDTAHMSERRNTPIGA